ncbi:glycoprotein [Burg el Arab virus]|uniref:Glycoprotein n=1 Tax=Burg el Arab virus TaxID=2686073 RepID=A0A6B9DHA3_9RHAB|nr:glycoprotein [Burg el Arab virus]QGX48514.1 glycoprotein [Burg el Arab virus]UAU42900.1 glycoprotein [Burg el Arab virus]
MTLNVRILFFMFLISKIWGLEYMYFPTSLKSDFRPIHLDHLNCPYDIDDTEIENPVEVNCKILVTNLIDLDGEVCYKQRWITNCHENFLGQQTIHHSIEHLTIDSNDLKKKLPLDKNLLPPDAECKWLSDTETSDIRTICQPVTIKYDETLMAGSHPSLGTFHCPSPPCKIDDQHIFVSTNVSTTQKGYKDIKVKFSTDKGGFIHDTSFVKSSIFPKLSLEGACVDLTKSPSNNNHFAKIILRSGLLLELKDPFDLGAGKSYRDGESIHVNHDIVNLKKLLLRKYDKTSIWGQTMFNQNSRSKMTFSNDVTGRFKQFGKLFVDLRICQIQDFNRIMVPTIDFQRSMTEMFVESKVDQLTCKRRLYDIMSSGIISGADLGLLAQNHEGIGPVYHIYKNDITVAYGNYERFTWEPKVQNGTRFLGYVHQGDNKRWIECPEWVKDPEHKGLEWCVNGIFSRNGSLYHPVFGGDNIEDLKIAYQTKNLRKVDHVSLLLRIENRNLTRWEEFFNLKSKRNFFGIDRVTNWFDGLSKEIKYIIWSVVGILALIMIIRVLRSRHRSNTYNHY